MKLQPLLCRNLKKVIYYFYFAKTCDGNAVTDMHDAGATFSSRATPRAAPTLFAFDLGVSPQNQKIWVSPRCSVSFARVAPSGRQPINLCRRGPDGQITIAEIIGTNTRRPIRAEEMSCCYFFIRHLTGLIIIQQQPLPRCTLVFTLEQIWKVW